MANEFYGESFSFVTDDGRTIDRAQFDREQTASADRKDLLAMKDRAENERDLALAKAAQLQKLVDGTKLK